MSILRKFIMGILILLGLIIFTFAILFFIKSHDIGQYRGPVSEHFNGKEFFNPGVDNKKTTLDLIKWWWSRERQPWPKHVANTPPDPVTVVTQPHQVKITFINHATVLIQSQQLNLLTDPIWSNRASPFSWWGPARVKKPGIAFSALPKIDVVLISHNHYDHLDKETLVALNKKFHPLFIAPLGNKEFLQKMGLTNVIELDWWQTQRIGNALITVLPTQHWSARWLNDKFYTLWASYGIDLQSLKIYFAGDTGYSQQNFNAIRQRWGRPDIALLPIGSYLPRWFMKHNHLNPYEAVKAHLDLQARYSIPIHYGTFQLSDEGINEPLEDLASSINQEGIAPGVFFVLSEGQGKIFTKMENFSS